MEGTKAAKTAIVITERDQLFVLAEAVEQFASRLSRLPPATELRLREACDYLTDQLAELTDSELLREKR